MPEPTVGIERGELVCPLCFSLCVPRVGKKLLRGVEWVWWCGCGWTSEVHSSPGTPAALQQRFASWRRLNRWSDLTLPNVH